MHEFLFPWRSRIFWRCWSWTAEGTIALCDGVVGGTPEWRGKDCLRFLRSAGLKLYFTLACARSSLNTLLTFVFSFADVSTKPFSQSTVTTDSVVAVSIWNKGMLKNWSNFWSALIDCVCRNKIYRIGINYGTKEICDIFLLLVPCSHRTLAIRTLFAAALNEATLDVWKQTRRFPS